MGTTTKRIVIQTIKEKDIWVQGVRNADFIGGGSLINCLTPCDTEMHTTGIMIIKVVSSPLCKVDNVQPMPWCGWPY